MRTIHTRPDRRRRRRAWVAAAALGCAAALAACGSSGGSSGATTGSGGSSKVASAEGLKFSQCMRAHGIAKFPDPSPGGGIQISASSGIDPSSPGFEAAQKACHAFMPGGGPGGGQPTEASKTHVLALARCLRSHGVNVADPTTTQPSPALGQGKQMTLAQGGVFLTLTAADLDSPALNRAAAACHFPLPKQPPSS